MTSQKTQPGEGSVSEYLDSLENEQARQDSYALIDLMQQASGEPPILWGESMIGFGAYHYCYSSGHSGEWFLTGFAPRKGNLTLYIMSGFDQYEHLLQRLGKYKTGKSCLYIKKLQDVDRDVLAELVRLSVDHMRATNP